MNKHRAVPACHTLVTKANSSHCIMMQKQGTSERAAGPPDAPQLVSYPAILLSRANLSRGWGK